MAIDEWNRLYQTLVDKGVLHVGNLSLFDEYCFTLGELRRCENLSKKVGADMAIMRGYFKAASVFRQQMRQLARDLKFTEMLGEKTVGTQEGKLAQFLRKPAQSS